MNIHRSHVLAAACIAVLLVSCSGKEPEPAPKAESAKAEPSAPAPTAAATDQAPAEAAPPASPASTQAAAAKSAPAQPVQAPATTAAPAKPAPTLAEPQAPAPAPAPASQPESKPAPSAPPASAAPSPKDVIILKASLGGVRFEHKQHSQARKIACDTCHHSSRAEKPATAPQQACGLCHTLVAAAPMKTKLQAAFHNATATAGTCIDCHKKESVAGKAAPVKCLDCHKRENK